MTQTREHYYCDLCGKEVENTELFKPFDNLGTFDGQLVIVHPGTDLVKDKILDVCDVCRESIMKAITRSIARETVRNY